MTNGSHANGPGEPAVVAIWRMDASGRVVRPCPYWARFSGQDYAAYAGHGWMDAVAGGQAVSPAMWQALFAEGKPRDVPCEILCADGTLRPILARLVPLGGQEEGEADAVEWLLTAVDISRAAKQSAHTRAEVSHLVSMVSHDLRGPLAAAIMGTQALLRSAALPESCKGRTQGIERSVRRAVRLLSDLVDYAQTRLGQGIPVLFKPASVFEILRRVVENARAANPGSEIVLELEGDGRGSWDSERLTQLFDTLLGEAIVRSGGKEPVRVHGAGNHGVTVRLECAGEPLSSEVAATLFGGTPASGLNALGRGKGAALGLYLVGPIVQAHRGTVTATPIPDGCRFQVELPRNPEVPRGVGR